MTTIIRLKIFSIVCLFFLFLSLTARELILSDLYLDSNRFWSISLTFGFLTGLLFSISLLRKGQTALDRFRILALMGIAGIICGPGVFGGFNRLRSIKLMDKKFTVEKVVPLVEGRGISLSDLESPDAYELFLESDLGFVKLKMQPSKVVTSLDSRDVIKLTIRGGIMGFHFFDSNSLQKL
jgi:hypothetical protein